MFTIYILPGPASTHIALRVDFALDRDLLPRGLQPRRAKRAFVLPPMMVVNVPGWNAPKSRWASWSKAMVASCGRGSRQGSPSCHACSGAPGACTCCRTERRTGESIRRSRRSAPRKFAAWSSSTFPAKASGPNLHATRRPVASASPSGSGRTPCRRAARSTRSEECVARQRRLRSCDACDWCARASQWP
jgi:hypothetical protein